MKITIERCTATTFRLTVTDEDKGEIVSIILNSLDDIADLLKVIKL
jgi:hypothetical protein